MGCSGSNGIKEELSKANEDKNKILQELVKEKDKIIALQNEKQQLNNLLDKMKEENKQEKEKIYQENQMIIEK